MKFNLMSMSNAKLDKDGICSINLPPKLSCPFAGECKAYCFACTGPQSWRGAKQIRLNNLELWENNPEQYEKFVIEDIHKAGRLVNRWNDSGDIVSTEYLKMMIRVANHYPDRHFYTYTKSIPFILKIGWENLPSNLKIIQSYGGTADHLIDESKPFAKIFKTEEEIPKDWTNATHSDLEAATSGTKIGIMAHGARKSKFKG